MTVILPRKTIYADKDQLKANKANKFIGKGSLNSSTHLYMLAYGEYANCGQYGSSDVVFISAEGARSKRLDPPWGQILKAMERGATLITDDVSNRERPYNIGERQVAKYIIDNGYHEVEPGVWRAIK